MKSNLKFQKKKSLVKKPSDVFSKCPKCGSPNLLKFEGDVFCNYCQWDSIILRAEAEFSALYPGTTNDTESAKEPVVIVTDFSPKPIVA